LLGDSNVFWVFLWALGVVGPCGFTWVLFVG
jgi:hypothetical protein